MRVRIPLYLQTVVLLMVHLVALFILFGFLFNQEFGTGWQSLVDSPAGERLEGISWALRQQLRVRPPNTWNEILQTFGHRYDVTFSIFDRRGTQVAGSPITLPPAVMVRVLHKRGSGGGVGFKPAESGLTQVGGNNSPVSVTSTGTISSGSSEEAKRIYETQLHNRDHHTRFVVETTNPSQFWVCVRFGIPIQQTQTAQQADAIIAPDGPVVPGMLVASCPNILSSKLLFDFRMIVLLAGGMVGLSLVIWGPFLYSLTRSLFEVTKATEKIAEGRFDSRLPVGRVDEIGRLAGAVNAMAGRLENFVTGQKRFLGDTAHELCSPVSRLQIALEILQDTSSKEQEGVINDIREEVDEITTLINDLLAFSKAGLQGKEIELVPINLSQILSSVLLKISAEKLVWTEMPADLQVLGDQLLLERALSNVIRNAVRYAAQDGPIQVKGQRISEGVVVTVTDSGPGVPSEALSMLGQPFFRPEPSRNRSSGGVGLGLSIVKSCVEACGGAFAVRNNRPRGLQVELKLLPANMVHEVPV